MTKVKQSKECENTTPHTTKQSKECEKTQNPPKTQQNNQNNPNLPKKYDYDLLVKGPITLPDLTKTVQEAVADLVLIEHNTPEDVVYAQKAKLLHMELVHLMHMWAAVSSPSAACTLISRLNRFLKERDQLLQLNVTNANKTPGTFVVPLD